MSFGIGGCGYTTRSMIADKFRSIYVAPFLNKINIAEGADTTNKYKVYRPFLETDVTKAVIDKFLSDGNLKPVSLESADLVLKGEIIEFRRDPLRYTSTDDVDEYRINVVARIRLWDNKENRLIWEDNYITGDNSYFITGVFAKSEDTATNNAISDLARRIVERTVEQW
jgi:hypothetical protein